jgi:two-component system osmolarity sensor histidine kinase EnvZ
VAWLQTFRALEFEPRAVQTAQQIASLVNLSRAALVHSDAIARVSLIKTLADQEGVRILPREPKDRFEPWPAAPWTERIVRRTGRPPRRRHHRGQQRQRREGLWIGFKIDRDDYWLLLDPTASAGGRQAPGWSG